MERNTDLCHSRGFIHPLPPTFLGPASIKVDELGATAGNRTIRRQRNLLYRMIGILTQETVQLPLQVYIPGPEIMGFERSLLGVSGSDVCIRIPQIANVLIEQVRMQITTLKYLESFSELLSELSECLVDKTVKDGF